MKRILSLVLILSLLLSFPACGLREETAFTVETTLSAPTTLPTETMPPTTQPAVEFSFAALRCTDFIFSSGAGAWGTRMSIVPDGSFSGTYSDHNNITGEGYPNGIYNWCDFSGHFSQPVQVNEYTYSMTLLDISYAKQPGTEEIKDQILYCYTDAYGLTGDEEFLIYLPGAPLAELPEEYRSWVGYSNLEAAEETALPFYGFYNAAQQQGFYGVDMVQAVREMVSTAEQEVQSIDENLGDAPTQADMNIAAQTKYQVWDNVLNSLWSVLKRTLDEETMAQLTAEELDWIEEKEQAIAEAGKEVEGGSLYPLVTGAKGAELTRQRVYELLELLP